TFATYYVLNGDMARAVSLLKNARPVWAALTINAVIDKTGLSAAESFAASLPEEARIDAIVAIADRLRRQNRLQESRSVVNGAVSLSGIHNHIHAAVVISRSLLDLGDAAAAQRYLTD